MLSGPISEKVSYSSWTSQSQLWRWTEGDGEVAREKAQMHGCLSQRGQEEHPDLCCRRRALLTLSVA